MNSAIYHGRVRHSRRTHIDHRFTNRICLLSLDLDEMEDRLNRRWLWSTRGPALARFRAEDHLLAAREAWIDADPNPGAATPTLKELAISVLAERGIEDPIASIRLLTQLRYFGFAMNPVSFFYCYDRQDQLLAIIAEVNNTPWGEQHLYVVDARGQIPQRTIRQSEIPKAFHVSPFLPLKMSYQMRFSRPADRLAVTIENFVDNDRQLHVCLSLKRRKWSDWNLLRSLLAFPLISFQLFLAIYWQALRLYLKGAIFYPHPGRHESTPPAAGGRTAPETGSRPHSHSIEKSVPTVNP